MLVMFELVGYCDFRDFFCFYPGAGASCLLQVEVFLPSPQL